MKPSLELDEILSTNLSNISVIRSVYNDLLHQHRSLIEQIIEQFLQNEQHFLSVINRSKSLLTIKKIINNNLSEYKQLLTTKYVHTDTTLVDQQKVEQLRSTLALIKDEVFFFLTSTRYFLDEFTASTRKYPVRLVFSNDLLFIINENSKKLQHVLAYGGMSAHRLDGISDKKLSGINPQNGTSSTISDTKECSNIRDSPHINLKKYSSYIDSRRNEITEYRNKKHSPKKANSKPEVNNQSSIDETSALLIKSSTMQQLIIAPCHIIESIESFFPADQTVSLLSPQRLLFNIRTNRIHNNPLFAIRDRVDLEGVLGLRSDEYLAYETTHSNPKTSENHFDHRNRDRKFKHSIEENHHDISSGKHTHEENKHDSTKGKHLKNIDQSILNKEHTTNFDSSDSCDEGSNETNIQVLSSPSVSKNTIHVPPLSPHHLIQHFLLKRLIFHLNRLDMKKTALEEKIDRIKIFYVRFVVEMIGLLDEHHKDINSKRSVTKDSDKNITVSSGATSNEHIIILLESHLCHILSFISPRIFYKRHTLSELTGFYGQLEQVLKPLEYDFTYLLKRLAPEKKKFERARLKMAKMEIMKILDEG